MPYVKPLGEKAIEKLYKKAGLTQEVILYLHRLFDAASNLYGALMMRDLWMIYKALPFEDVKIKRSDIIEFSTIVRRESQGYEIYDIDELYSLEKRGDMRRFLVNKSLIGAGRNRFNMFYFFMKARTSSTYTSVDDFFSYADSVMPEEEALSSFLSSLTSTSFISRGRYDISYPNLNRGKRLGEFSFITKAESAILMSNENNSTVYSRLSEEYSGPESIKIMRLLKRGFNIGRRFEYMAHYLSWELSEAGVSLIHGELEELAGLLSSYYKNTRFWFLSGETAGEVAERFNDGNIFHDAGRYIGVLEDVSLKEEDITTMLSVCGIENAE